MKKSLFGQRIPPSCAYCKNSVFENEVTYCQKGKQLKYNKCRSFKYDPLMRIPKNIKADNDFSPEDFKL